LVSESFNSLVLFSFYMFFRFAHSLKKIQVCGV